MKKLTVVAITLLALVSCTDNESAKNYGGTQKLKISPQEKFINITWKANNIWVITQDTITKTYFAREKSSMGIMEGTIIISK